MDLKFLGVSTLAVALAAAPALAQTHHNAPGTGTHATHNNEPEGVAPSQRNPVLTDQGDSRASKVIGSDVYNGQDKKVGTIDDIVIGHSAKSVSAIISSSGRLVSVPYDRLQFGDTRQNGNNKVVLANATADSLKNMPEYHYTAKH